MRADDPEIGVAIRFVKGWRDIGADIDVYRFNSEEGVMGKGDYENEAGESIGGPFAPGATAQANDPDYRRRENLERAERLSDMINRASAGEGSEPMTIENVDRMFEYMPWNSAQQDAGDQVREALVAACKAILRNVRPSRLRTRALNSIYDARMLANAAITHRGRF